MNEKTDRIESLRNIISRCVDCKRNSIKVTKTNFVCTNRECNRVYKFANGILDCWPKYPSYIPSFYKTKMFKKWEQAWEDMIEDWFIYSNSVYRTFTMSGHHKSIEYYYKICDTSKYIIDLGCGNGALLPLIRNPIKYIGLDSNKSFLSKLKTEYPESIAIHSDICNTPFLKKSLHCIISIHTLEHIYKLAECFEEIIRIMRPKGQFIFSIPTEGGFGWKMGRKFITVPYLKKKYNLDGEKIMSIEHINDAQRVLKFINLYFHIKGLSYTPFKLPFLSINQSITGIAQTRLDGE